MKSIIINIPSLKRDFIFCIGQNAEDNDNVIDCAHPDDLWFHVAHKSSCHITAAIPDDITRKDLKYIINQGATLCKKMSYPTEKKLDILFTKIKYVQKTDIAGKVIIMDGHGTIKTV
jgi:predicted ribosome quality control (RQC) complex YloA/Tae2 family protein